MITIVGCGTLGSRVAHQLKDHRLALIDHDVVKKHNLQSQQYTKRDVGTQKVYALMRNIPTARTHNVFLDSTNQELLRDAEVVVDCTDNLLTRELIDEYCYDHGIPLVHAAAARSRGVVGLFCGKQCLRCVYQDKISLENCRGNEIDEAIAQKIAEQQARLVREVLAGEEHPSLALVTTQGLEPVRLSSDCGVCDEETTSKDWYVTWCPQAQCLSAKRLQPQEMRPREETIDGVQVRVLGNGELHFSGEEDVDVLERVAEKIYASS